MAAKFFTSFVSSLFFSAPLVYQRSPVVIKPPTTTLYFVGDIMLDRGVALAANRYGGGDDHWPFKRADFLGSADLVFGNLEGPLSDQGRKRGSVYSFRMAPANAAVLRTAGFRVLSLANNHSGDYDLPALLDTRQRLKEAGIETAGAGRNIKEASEPAVLKINGVKFGFLAFSDVGPEWLKADQSSGRILSAKDPDFSGIIARAADKTNVLVVSIHWGKEYQTEPNARQREVAQMALAAGARIVIGHHPHVVQPVEKIGDQLVAYSLGNFVFDQYFSSATMQGWLLEVVFEGTKIKEVKERTTKLTPQYQVYEE